MGLWFAKYEGIGNDFILIDGEELSTAQAVALCDRHRGVGADGVLLLDAAPNAVQSPRMRVINADGSKPEMCGNGLRCVALHWVRTGRAAVGQEFTVATDAGPHRCVVTEAGRTSLVEVKMRAASLKPTEVPVLADHELLDAPFDVAGTRVRLSCVSMGNPHGVTFDDLGPAARATLGPLLEKDRRFPNAANIGFARVLGPTSIELAVWERGVGFTEACGTGACACAVAAVETGRAERGTAIEVHLPGGALEIVVGARHEPISMTGPARHVFDGVVD
jgi:diaminopimelate epimerase